MDINEIIYHLKSKVSKYRFEHTLRVTQTAKELSKIHNLSREINSKIELASVLHDILKESTPESLIEEDYSVSLESISLYKNFQPVWHALEAPKYINFKFNIKDTNILDAVKFHCTGNQHLNIVAKIVFIADYIEPLRNLKDRDFLEQISKENINKTISIIVSEIYNNLKSRKQNIHPLTISCYDYYRKYV